LKCSVNYLTKVVQVKTSVHYYVVPNVKKSNVVKY
ncbi:Elongation factor Tu, partial [Haemophilus influenzae]